MKILILGGTGAIGKVVADYLSREHTVYVTTRQKLKSSCNINYINGNAMDASFLKTLLIDDYDVIIDFMHYSKIDFITRIKSILNNTKHYYFFSSCRIFADSTNRIDENSPQLINSGFHIDNKDYAIEKSECEQVLKDSGFTNYTIIRPYITFDYTRLSLGFFDKENWLYRIVNNKPFVFSKELYNKKTTIAHSSIIAEFISNSLLKKEVMSEAFNVTGFEEMTWGEILEIYKKSIEKWSIYKPTLTYYENNDLLSKAYGNYNKYRYDRKYNRIFDNQKSSIYIKNYSKNSLVCLIDNEIKLFFEKKCGFKQINIILEALMDRITKTKTKLMKIKGWRNKVKYIIVRYTPLYKLFINRYL